MRISLTFLFFHFVFISQTGFSQSVPATSSDSSSLSETMQMYVFLGEEDLSYEVFRVAYEGFKKIQEKDSSNENTLSVIDFSLPSNVKRYFLIDVKNKSILHKDFVAHGKNSGLLYATEFSNRVNSNQSSLGFYRTAETYYGKHGLSLRLDGLEKGINHNARNRAIVMHAAAYAENTFLTKHKRLGRSLGCPAMSKKGFNKVIPYLSQGSILFIYANNNDYKTLSALAQ